MSSPLNAVENEGRPFNVSAIIKNHLDHLVYERWLASEFEIGLGQFCVLQFIREQSGHPQADIARGLGFHKATMTKIVETMVARGILVRHWSPDRRAVICDLTPAGLEFLERIEAALTAESEGVT
jgi:DNA-binding MarR family transcriptional regulator